MTRRRKQSRTQREGGLNDILSGFSQALSQVSFWTTSYLNLYIPFFLEPDFSLLCQEKNQHKLYLTIRVYLPEKYLTLGPFHNHKGLKIFLFKPNTWEYTCVPFTNTDSEWKVGSRCSLSLLGFFFAFSIVQKHFLFSPFTLFFFPHHLTPTLFLFLSHFKGFLIEMCRSN